MLKYIGFVLEMNKLYWDSCTLEYLSKLAKYWQHCCTLFLFQHGFICANWLFLRATAVSVLLSVRRSLTSPCRASKKKKTLQTEDAEQHSVSSRRDSHLATGLHCLWLRRVASLRFPPPTARPCQGLGSPRRVQSHLVVYVRDTPAGCR